MATSSCDAEYRVPFTTTVECVWLKRLCVADLGVGQPSATTIFTDNQSTLAVVRNLVFHTCTKHIEVHYHYVKERLSTSEISLAYMPTQDNLVDLFTKALPLMRSSKLFTKLSAYFLLWIDHSPYGLALPYILSALPCYGSDVCVCVCEHT